MAQHLPSRRRFLKFASYGLVALGTGQLLRNPVVAAELPHLELDDPMAKALGYVHATPEPGKLCSNCLHIRGDEAQWRECALFPGKLVNNDGWCKGWAAKPS